MDNHTEVEVLLVEDNPRDAEMTLRVRVGIAEPRVIS